MIVFFCFSSYWFRFSLTKQGGTMVKKYPVCACVLWFDSSYILIVYFQRTFFHQCFDWKGITYTLISYKQHTNCFWNVDISFRVYIISHFYSILISPSTLHEIIYFLFLKFIKNENLDTQRTRTKMFLKKSSYLIDMWKKHWNKSGP